MQWIQEKVLQSNYPNFMFEYKKRSGVDGWAISKQEKADWLVYYMAGTIYMMKFDDVRAFLIENLDLFKRKYYFKTDNHNVNVPKAYCHGEYKSMEGFSTLDYLD